MPPKKKKDGDGKKGKKGKKSGKKDVAPKPKEEEISESSKEFYLIQIKDLEDRLIKYQRKCDELEVKQGQYENHFNQMSSDKKEIVSHLKTLLEGKGIEVEDLNDRLLGLQQAKDQQKDNYDKMLQDERSRAKEEEETLRSENAILQGKLSLLQDFEKNKEELYAEMNSLKEELIKNEEDHKEEIYNIERKQVVDKDRLKKEMVLRVNQVAAEFRKVSNKQMAETTKRTIRENVSINAQLCKMSDKTMELLQENEDLKKKEKDLEIKVNILEAESKEHCKKYISGQKIIRMLKDKGKDQEDLIAQYDLKMQQYEELEQDTDSLRTEYDEMKNQYQSMQLQLEKAEQRSDNFQTEMIQERKSKDKLVNILMNAAEALKSLLSKKSTEDAEESIYDKMEKKDGVLEQLLIILNSAAALGIGPKPTDFARKSKNYDDYDDDYNCRRSAISPSMLPGSGGLKRRDVVVSPLAKVLGASVTHYKLGDLGLVPRPEVKVNTNFERHRDLSATSRNLGRLKKLNTRSIGVQTLSLSKATFFSEDLLGNVPETGKLGILPPAQKQRQLQPKLVF